jgi:hypothetical protein
MDRSANRLVWRAENTVADRKPLRQDTSSPHVLLRQAIRPVTVAYGILSDQRLAASALAEEAQTLVGLTEEMLRKLGLVHLLTAGAVRPDGDPAPADQAERTADAYARVGMSWALVLSSVTRLGKLLVDDDNWTDATLLASLLTEAGESAVATHIEGLVRDARNSRHKAQLGAIRFRDCMTGAEILRAVDLLMALEPGPAKIQAIRTRRHSLIQSLYAITRQKQNQFAIGIADDLYSRYSALAEDSDSLLEDDPDYGLPDDVLFNGIITALDQCGG